MLLNTTSTESQHFDSFFETFKAQLISIHAKQFKQEDTIGSSSEQYKAGLIWATTFLASIIKQDYESNGGSWDDYVVKYDLVNINKNLKCKDIDLALILNTFGLDFSVAILDGINYLEVMSTFEVAPFDNDEVVVLEGTIDIIEAIEEGDYCTTTDFLPIEIVSNGNCPCSLQNFFIFIANDSGAFMGVCINQYSDCYTKYYMVYQQSADGITWTTNEEGIGLIQSEFSDSLPNDYLRIIIKCGIDSTESIIFVTSKPEVTNINLYGKIKIMNHFNNAIIYASSNMQYVPVGTILTLISPNPLLVFSNGLTQMDITSSVFDSNQYVIQMFVSGTSYVVETTIDYTFFALATQSSVNTPMCFALGRTLTCDYISTYYQWYKDGVAIGGANSSTVFVNTPGNYTCKYDVLGVIVTMQSEIISSELPEYRVELEIWDGSGALASGTYSPSQEIWYKKNSIYYAPSSSLGFYFKVKGILNYIGTLPVDTLVEWVNYTAPTANLDLIFVNLTDYYKAITTIKQATSPNVFCVQESDNVFADFSTYQQALIYYNQDVVLDDTINTSLSDQMKFITITDNGNGTWTLNLITSPLTGFTYNTPNGYWQKLLTDTVSVPTDYAIGSSAIVNESGIYQYISDPFVREFLYVGDGVSSPATVKTITNTGMAKNGSIRLVQDNGVIVAYVSFVDNGGGIHDVIDTVMATVIGAYNANTFTIAFGANTPVENLQTLYLQYGFELVSGDGYVIIVK